MRVTQGQLRRLVLEAVVAQTDKRAYETVSHALLAAKKFVDQIVLDKRDSALAEDLQTKSAELNALSRFLTQKDAPYAELVAQVAQHVKNIADKSGLLASVAGHKKMAHKDMLSKELYAGRKAYTDFANKLRDMMVASVPSKKSA